MRLLIGLYLALGIVQIVASVITVFLSARSILAPGPRGSNRSGLGEEGLFVVAVPLLVVGCVTLLGAYGLWKRWRFVRLVLLGLSWWTLAVCAFAASVALAQMAGWSDNGELGFRDSPWETLATALSSSAFAAWQILVLTRPSVRNSFRRTV